MGYYIRSLVRFGQLLDPTIKTNFLKIVIRKLRKFPYEKLTFFLDKLMQKIFFVFHSRYTWDTTYGVWFDLDNSLTRR